MKFTSDELHKLFYSDEMKETRYKYFGKAYYQGRFDEKMDSLYPIDLQLIGSENSKMIETEDEIVQYFIVNSDLNMSAGKIAAQVAHVATLITNKYSQIPVKNSPYAYDTFKRWLEHNQKKVILRGKEKDLIKLLELNSVFHIRDNGHTEVPAGSLTCVGFPPEYKSIVRPYVKRLQVL